MEKMLLENGVSQIGGRKVTQIERLRTQRSRKLRSRRRNGRRKIKVFTRKGYDVRVALETKENGEKNVEYGNKEKSQRAEDIVGQMNEEEKEEGEEKERLVLI